MKKIRLFTGVLIVAVFVAIPAMAAISPHSQAVIDGTLLHKGAKDYVVKVDTAKTPDGKPIDELKGKDISMPADMATQCEKLTGKKVRMTCSVDKDCKCGNCSSLTERKIKYYKSTMMKDETSPTPKKDSMGMEMAPVYEGDDGGPRTGSRAESGAKK